MINKNAKGKRSENKTKDLFETNGFVDHSTVRSSYQGTNDIFGLFDHVLMTLYPMRIVLEETFMDLAGTELEGIIFIQTRSNRFRSIEELKQFFTKFHRVVTTYELVWKDREDKPYMRAYTWDPTDRTVITQNVVLIFTPYSGELGDPEKDIIENMITFKTQRINGATNYQLIEEVPNENNSF